MLIINNASITFDAFNFIMPFTIWYYCYSFIWYCIIFFL
jgi:hypothetical protein